MRNLSNLSSVPNILPDSIEHPREYFTIRGTRFESVTNNIFISQDSHWGYLVTVIGRSHELIGPPDTIGRATQPTINVSPEAWICSRALLHDCKIGRGAVVAAGTVVRGQTVAPYRMVAGNPARVIASWEKDQAKWIYRKPTNTGFFRDLV